MATAAAPDSKLEELAPRAEIREDVVSAALRSALYMPDQTALLNRILDYLADIVKKFEDRFNTLEAISRQNSEELANISRKVHY